MHCSMSRLHSDRVTASSYFYISNQKKNYYENDIRQRNKRRNYPQDQCTYQQAYRAMG